MEKKELEIRLKVAVDIINKSLILLSEEHRNEVLQKHDYADVYIKGQILFTLESYDDRALREIQLEQIESKICHMEKSLNSPCRITTKSS